MLNLYNLYGYAALLIWSFSALLIDWTTQLQPLGVLYTSSLLAFLLFLCKWAVQRKRVDQIFSKHWQVWALFLLGLFAYRLFFYSGLKLAPVIEANLINYLWPLFMVVFARAFTQQRPGLYIFIGALSCFIGIVFIGLGNADGQLFLTFEIGHILAFFGALSWAFYSVMTGLHKESPPDMVGIMAGLCAVVFYAAHKIYEPPIAFLHLDVWNWIGIAGLSISASVGPWLWDISMNKGARAHIAVLSYFTPLLSTFWLILFSDALMNVYTYAACAFILFGTILPRFSPRNKGV